MACDAIIRNALDSIDDSLTECLGPGCITGVSGGVSAISKGSLDRLDQDIGTVIGSSTVDVEGVTIGSLVPRVKGLCRRILSGIHDCVTSIDWASRGSY